MKATQFIVRYDGYVGRGSTPERAVEDVPDAAGLNADEHSPVYADGDTDLNITRVYHT